MKKKWNILLVFFFVQSYGWSQINTNSSILQVSANGHFLQFEDGRPFFWLGDTGWELFHRLTIDEVASYLENRRAKGFTVIQAAILAEFDGLRKPNQYGELPFRDLNPDKPNENYFRWVDTVIRLAARKNLYMALLPTWGDKVTLAWGEGPVVFDTANAYRYGRWLGNRYKGQKNIIWMLGGDRPPLTDTMDFRPVWRAMATGILQGTGGNALITYHTTGGPRSTSQQIHGESWLMVNTMQSGHGAGHDVPVWEWVSRDSRLVPVKPTLDAEPNYEDHPVNPWPKWDPANGYFSDYDVRKQTYRSVFAGACGVTYGHHSVWQFWSPREEKINFADCYWTTAIDRPGAFQVGYLRRLMESRPLLNRIADQGLLVEGQGSQGQYGCAWRSADSSTIMVYIPYGKKISVNTLGLSSQQIVAWWFNPRNGLSTKIGLLDRENTMSFVTPTLGLLNDWVLVLDNQDFRYAAPATVALRR